MGTPGILMIFIKTHVHFKTGGGGGEGSGRPSNDLAGRALNYSFFADTTKVAANGQIMSCY